jgi:hypothetical protein
MKDLNFNELVRKFFNFLEDYGFKISDESNPDTQLQTDGFVEYKSDSIVVMVDSDRAAASVWFYRIKDGRKFYLTPIDIDEYLNTSENEKTLLLSTNPKDKLAASTLFNQKLLLNQPDWKSNGTTQENLELYLKNYAGWLKRNANLCITGDFSRWAKFYEYKINRARADYLRRGQDEMVLTQIKDTDGNYKLVKQPMFKEKLEHAEKLKREFPG